MTLLVQAGELSEVLQYIDHALQVVSSAIVDKYIGESARIIREMFGWVPLPQMLICT